jgi:hypothetical protein
MLSKSADSQIIAPHLGAKPQFARGLRVAPRYQKKALHIPVFGRIVISQQSTNCDIGWLLFLPRHTLECSDEIFNREQLEAIYEFDDQRSPS